MYSSHDRKSEECDSICTLKVELSQGTYKFRKTPFKNILFLLLFDYCNWQDCKAVMPICLNVLVGPSGFE